VPTGADQSGLEIFEYELINMICAEFVMNQTKKMIEALWKLPGRKKARQGFLRLRTGCE